MPISTHARTTPPLERRGLRRWKLSGMPAAIVAVLSLSCGGTPCLAADASSGPVRLLALDIELVGDLSDPDSAATHAPRLAMASERLRAELAQDMRYDVVDAAPAQEHIDSLRAVQYLHKCNGCEIDIATELGADQVLVAWVYRVSQLILTLNYEVRAVPGGETLRRKSFDFRGDNDQSWTRAVSYMVKDLTAQ
jgi:hypothetical protein